jgi:H+/Cl- antiporter ClcA
METFGDEEDGYSCYLIWTGHAVLLIMIAACTTRYISPQAAGSGVAEMKVIIRGVVIKEYLSARTLLAKLIGVPFMLAAGFGLGKEVRNLYDYDDFTHSYLS